MFYEPKDGHGLPRNPFNAIVTPRPIGWISTRGGDGRENLSPYSFFNAVAYVPPQVVYASTALKAADGEPKDTLGNVRDTGVFCVNIVEAAMLETMSLTSGTWPRETDEFDLAGVPREDCRLIPCSRVATAPAALECRVVRIEKLLGDEKLPDHWRGGRNPPAGRLPCRRRFDVTRFQPVSRLGYRDYAIVRDVIELARPRRLRLTGATLHSRRRLLEPRRTPRPVLQRRHRKASATLRTANHTGNS